MEQICLIGILKELGVLGEAIAVICVSFSPKFDT